MRFQSIHFHRWFEAGLKANCIMTGINAGVIYSRVINLAIWKEITSVMLMLRLGKVLDM